MPYLIKRGLDELSSLWSLLVPTLCVLAALWVGHGMQDNAIVASAGIFIIAAMISTSRVLAVVWLIFVANIISMALLTHLGLYSPTIEPYSVGVAVSLVVMLTAIAIFLTFQTNDNRQLIRSLHTEIERQDSSRKKIEHTANHDQLTGLENRLASQTYFNELENLSLANSIKPVAALLINLDEFKFINDTLGHAMGDKYLIESSSRIKKSINKEDRLFRIGGDEFLIFTKAFNSEEQLVSIVEKIQAQLKNPLVDKDQEMRCSASIGIVIVPTDAKTYSETIKCANIAMTKAKEQGKNTYRFYDEEIESEMHMVYELQRSITSGLSKGEFYVEFQAIVDISRNQCVGAEALLRWQHPTYGLVPPDVFIPLAEKKFHIDQLSIFVIQQTTQLLDITAESHPDFYISVNISPMQLSKTGIGEKLLVDLKPDQLKRLKIEVTESQIIKNIEVYEENTKALKKHNIGIFLDDFGMGYSNLAYLQRLRVDCLKVDRSFTQNIDQDIEKQPVMRAIINLASEMKIKVIIEGVENEDELQTLKNMNAPYGQGYYWSKPVSQPALLDYLKNQCP